MKTQKLLIILFGLVLGGEASAKDSYLGIERIVAVGDLHGDYEQYITVLRNNGLVDEQSDWQGGETHFVQLGDVVDRGPGSLKIIRHLMRLEKQAKRAGGAVHVLIGNHEVMNIQADLRYVHPGEYSALVTSKSEMRQNNFLNKVYASRLSLDPTLEEREQSAIAALKVEFPLGYVEHRKLWEPGQEIARWVAKHNTIVKINDSLFLHAGLNPHEELLKLSTINKRVKKELSRRAVPSSLTNKNAGPLWYRGLAKNPRQVELEPLINMLAFYNVRRIVIAHTPTPGLVLSRFDGRVVMIDVGMSKAYGGAMANLLIEGDAMMALHRGQRIALPSNGDFKAYLEAVARLESGNMGLLKYVETRLQGDSLVN